MLKARGILRAISLNGYRLLIYAIFISLGPRAKNYIIESPFAFLRWRRTPSRLPRHGKSMDKTARPGLHSEASVPSHFSSLLRLEEIPPRSAQGQGTLLEEATSAGLPAFLLLVLSRPSTKPKREVAILALILLSLSSVIPVPVETPIDGMPARSSLSFSWGLLNSRTRQAKRRTRRAHWSFNSLNYLRSEYTTSFALTRSFFKLDVQISFPIYSSNKDIFFLTRVFATVYEQHYPKARRNSL